jgi:PAS domain S-box-containing protein
VAAEVLRTAFERAPVGVGVCDEDGRFVAVNESLAALLGEPVTAIIGRPFLTFVHPQERAAALACYFASVVAAAGEPKPPAAHAELRCVTGEDAVVWLAASWTITGPDPDGHQYGVVHLRDVTEHRAVQEQLARAQHLFELAFDCAPIGIAVVGPDGRFLHANRALQVMLGYSETDLLQRSFAELIDPAERDNSLAVFDQLLTGELEVHESVKRYLHRDGHTVHARRFATAARQPDGQADYLLIQIEDITAERHSTDRLTDLHIRDRVTGLGTAASLALQIELSPAPRTLVLIGVDDPARLTATRDAADLNDLVGRLADRLAARCRHGELVARVGDAELAVVLDHADPAAGSVLAARLRDDLARPIRTGDGASTICARVGVDTDPTGTRPLSALLHHARLAAQATCDNAQSRTFNSR